MAMSGECTQSQFGGRTRERVCCDGAVMAPILVWEPSRAELRKVADNRVGRQETLPIQQTLEVLVEKKDVGSEEEEEDKELCATEHKRRSNSS